ncbi:PAS domain S-box protein [Rubellimicrobium arenae]|uniref:PAS domain S-box protein n=1 Tax=Rubellimicrobium arenae TaxID=2817372 RepID=UPI001B3090CD|nr:PAS domain S-box protein [Rubellimicrobium arenae]
MTTRNTSSAWPPGDSEMARRIREHDWTATPLGPVEGWPERLKVVAELMLASPRVSTMVVGPERVLLYNDTAARLFGARHPGALGRPHAEALPEGDPAVAPLYDRAFAGEAIDVPAQPASASEAGGEVWDGVLTPVWDGAGGVLAVHGFATEVGARFRAQAFLLRLSDALRAEPDVDAVADRALRMLSDELRLDRCCISLYRPDEEEAVFPYQVGNDTVPPLPPTVRLSDFPEVYEQALHGTFVIDDDVEGRGLPESERAKSKALGMRAMLASTIRRGEGRAPTSLMAVSSRARRWTPEEIALVEEAAERTWAAMERARAEAALRGSEAKFRTLFDAIDEGLAIQELVYDNQGEIIDVIFREVNAAYERQSGLHDVIGRSLFDVLPRVEDYWVDLYRELVRTGRPVRVQHYQQDVDGWFDVYFSPVGEGGRFVAHVFNNITERKRAEAALRDSEERQAFLLALGDAMRVQTSAEEVVETAARLLGLQLKASRVAFGEFDDEHDLVHIRRGWTAEGAETHPATLRQSDFLGPLLDELRAGVTVCFDDVGEPPYARPDLEALAAIGVRAGLSVPLIDGGRLALNLMVHNHEPYPWTDAEVALTQETAERTWAAMARARAEAALRDSEVRYRSLFESMDQGYALGDVIFDEAGHAVDVIYLEANPAAARILGVDIAGRRMSEIADWELAWYEHWGRVARTGQPERREDFANATGQWFDFYLFKPDPEDASSPRVAVLFEDVTERRTAEDRLRASEERFRAIVQTAADHAIFTTDAAGRIETWPAGAQEVFGWSAEEAVGQPVGMTFTPEDREAGQPAKERQEARENGHAPDVRWHQRKDGSRVFIEGMTRPLTGPDGRVTGFLKVGQDVTERRATEEALRSSEARFRQFGEASADVLWIRDAESLAFEYVSPAFEEIYGTKLEDILGGNHVRRWADLILPEDRDKALEALRQVREGEHVLHAFRILRPDGQVCWIRDTDFPLLDEAGRVQRIAGIGHDATAEVELQDRLRVLVAELQHRSRNLVGVVKGVTEKTFATAETLDDFRARFRPRLDALARVNGLLSRLEDGDRITFDQLLQTELQAHGIADGDGHGQQISLRGPKGIRLRSATVQTFALALHELATNALKYGALSKPEGHLEVKWSLVPGQETEQRLRVDWRESGVPVLHPDGAPNEAAINGQPQRRRQGYGRELIERALPYQLKAQTTYELTPDGVRCTIIVPVSSTLDVAFSSQGDPDG